MIKTFLLAAALICPRPSDPALIGLWESADTSRGGIGHTIEFREDGTFVEAITVMVNLHYRLKGDHLFVGESHSGEEPARENAAIVKIGDRTLVATAPDGSLVEKQRMGARNTGKSSLVGAWRYRHYTGAIAFERYTPDGQLLFRLPMSSSVGCFVSHGSQLTLAQPKAPEKSITYEISTDQLVLRESGGRPSKYRKELAGPWYDREHLDYKSPK